MRYTETLKWGIIGGLGLLLFIPFIIGDGSIFPNMFFPFITGKNFAFRILVEIMFGAYVLLALREPKYRPRGSLIMWAACALVVWVGIATMFSVDPLKSFWSNFERMEGYIGLLHVFMLFIIAGAVLTAEQWWEKFFKISIGVATLQGFYALFQVLGWAAISTQSGARVDTSFGNATYLAVYMLFNIFLTLFILVRERQSRMTQSLYGIALVLQVVALLNTQTRGAILGLIGGLVIAALYVVWKGTDVRYGVLRKWSIGLVIGIVVLVAGFIALRNSALVHSSSTLSRLASISLQDKTTQSRFMIWGMAYQGFVEKPLLGWGQENFSFVFNKYYNPAMYDQEQWFDRAHNQFIDWLLAAGLPAFLFFLSLFFLGAWAVYRSTLEVPAQAVFLGLLGGYAFHSMFVFDNLISAMYFFLLVAFMHGLLPRQVPRFMVLSRPASDHTVAIAAPIVVVLVVGGIWMLQVPGLTRAQTIIDAITTQKAVTVNGSVTGAPRDPKENLAVFERALTMGFLGRQETVEQLYQFSSSLANNTSVSPEIKQQAYEMTRREGEQLLAERHGDARLELFLGTFLNQFGRHNEALEHFTLALEYSPNKQQILFQSGGTRLALGDLKGALQDFKKAFDADPKYADARISYATGLYYNNQATQADALLTEGFGSMIIDNERLLQLYTNFKIRDRVIGIWKIRVEQSPKNVETRINLASAYFTAGDIPKTIEVLKAALALDQDPATASQIQTIITQIQNGTLKSGQ
ncbi:MAG: O-antigen ligase family protein [Patescibacteria group bacterium]